MVFYNLLVCLFYIRLLGYYLLNWALWVIRSVRAMFLKFCCTNDKGWLWFRFCKCGAVGIVFVLFCESSYVFGVVDSLVLYSFN